MFRRKGKHNGSPSVAGRLVAGDDLIVRAEGVTKTYHTGADRITALRGVDVAVPYRWVRAFDDILILSYFPTRVELPAPAAEVEEELEAIPAQ